MADTVLVTGATGFVAQHCILQLLEGGYEVRGTARRAGRTEEVAAVLRPHLSAAVLERLERFEVVAADLTDDAGWAEAVAGCRFVLHVASPVPRTPPQDPRDIIDPAREGTLRVLKAAEAAGVERVVLTSSVASVLYGKKRDRTFTEDDWSDVDGPNIGAYEMSKTLAEKAAWAFAKAHSDGPELVTVNPGLILGPLLSSDWGTSGEVVKKLMRRELPAVPNVHFAAVDVRDVADLHLRAMTAEQAAGRRYICAIESHSMREMAHILDSHLRPKGIKVPTKKLPTALMKVAAVFDPTVKLALNDVDVRQDVDNSRARTELGWAPRGLEEMLVSMADSMLEHGVVQARA